MNIPMNQWGKDHWSTLAYIETRCMDYEGYPDHNHMRTDQDIHPGLVGHITARVADVRKYPTRLKDGKIQKNHDDWNCVDDMVLEGLIENIGTGFNPIFKLTDYGMMVANALRNHKQSGGTFGNFEYTPIKFNRKKKKCV